MPTIPDSTELRPSALLEAYWRPSESTRLPRAQSAVIASALCKESSVSNLPSTHPWSNVNARFRVLTVDPPAHPVSRTASCEHSSWKNKRLSRRFSQSDLENKQLNQPQMKTWNEYIILVVVCAVDLESFPARYVTVVVLQDYMLHLSQMVWNAQDLDNKLQLIVCLTSRIVYCIASSKFGEGPSLGWPFRCCFTCVVGNPQSCYLVSTL